MDSPIDRCPGQCETATVAGFIQQVAVGCVARGHVFYVAGSVPGHKSPRAVDAKLVARYDLAHSKWARSRRRRLGIASVRYLRHGRFFLLLATHGRHRFFAREGRLVRDCRREPIRCFGYSISSRRGHTHVRIEAREFRCLKAHLVKLASHRSAEQLAAVFRALPFEPYAPVRRQLLELWRAVNGVRKTAGFGLVPRSCVRMLRRIERPFVSRDEKEDLREAM